MSSCSLHSESSNKEELNYNCVSTTNPIKKIEVVAHRGANRLAPENTFAAAKKCVELKLSYVEIDVRKSSDGIYYIFHDPILNRTSNGSGLFSWTHSSRLDQLDAGSWFGEAFKGEKIPRLKEFLNWSKGKIKVYIDFKAGDVEEVVSLVRAADLAEDCFFYFSDDKKAEAFYALAPDIPLKINANTAAEIPIIKEKYGADIVECRVWEMTEEFTKACQRHNIKIMAYPKYNTAEEYCQIINANADMINLDRAYLFSALLEKIN